MLKYQYIRKELLKRTERRDYIDKLPSIRALMNEFQASQSTVVQALHQLRDSNKIYIKENIGYFVLPRKKNGINSNQIFDFSTSSTSWADFPLDSYAKCLEVALNNEKTELFRYGPVDGHQELKKLFQKLLEEEQIYFKLDQLLITSGTQQALHLLALSMNDPESFLIEQPSYHLMIKLLERLKIQHATFHRQIDQIDLNVLEKTIQKNQPKYLFLMPRLHNPLGTTMSDFEKKAILELAHKYNFYIIEDDYLSDFERTSKYQTMFELDTNHRVIYLKSFSKIMFPGQRLGLIILPEELVQDFAQLKEVTDIQTNSLSQVIMQAFIESGLFEYHRDKIVERHKEKVSILRHSLKKHLIDYPFRDNYQMHTVIELPNEMNMDKLYHELEKRNIRVDIHKNNYVKNYKQNYKFLRLNTTGVENSQIDLGVSLIAEAIKKSKVF